MTTVNVVLTPGVDTDQTASAQSQITAAPDGTLGSPTIINMPAGRYRIDGFLRVLNKSHIRWTCLAGVQVYPNTPSNSQAFIAYTDKSQYALTGVARRHMMIQGCDDVVGSFMRVEGPGIQRTTATNNPAYVCAAYRGAGYEAESGFSITSASNDCGWEDCSTLNTYGDGFYIGGQSTPNNDGCWMTRFVIDYPARHNIGLINADNFTATDVVGKWAGFGGIDIEPNAALERVWGAKLVRVDMNSRHYNYSFNGGSSNHPSKKDLWMVDCVSNTNGDVTKPGVFIGIDSGGYLIIDGLTDMRNRNNVGIRIGAECAFDDVTIKNCRVRGYPNTVSTYAVSAAQSAVNSLTITNNNFNGTTAGFDFLKAGTSPPIYVHWGNVWDMGAQNDGSEPIPPVALFAVSKQITIAGGVATTTVVPAPPAVGPPPGTYVAAFRGGAPFRLRSRKGWSRMRGAAGARLRGAQGNAERHPMRLRSPNGRARLRSASHPSYLRSKQPISVPSQLLSAATGSVTLTGGVATLSSKLVATSGALALHGTTAGITIVNTIIVLPAVSRTLTLTGGDHTTGFRQAVTSGTLTLVGSATTLVRKLPATPKTITLAGGVAHLSVRLAATSRTLVLAGSNVALNGQSGLAATSGQFTMAGGTARLSIRTAAVSKVLTLTGGNATLALGKTLHATPGELAFHGGQIALSVLNRVGTGTITIHGGSAELGGNTILNIPATPGTITITGGTATLRSNTPYPEWPMGELAPEWEMVGV